MKKYEVMRTKDCVKNYKIKKSDLIRDEDIRKYVKVSQFQRQNRKGNIVDVKNHFIVSVGDKYFFQSYADYLAMVDTKEMKIVLYDNGICKSVTSEKYRNIFISNIMGFRVATPFLMHRAEYGYIKDYFNNCYQIVVED